MSDWIHGAESLEDQFREPRVPKDHLASEATRLGVHKWDPYEEGFPDAQYPTKRKPIHDIPYSYGRHLDNPITIDKLTFYNNHPEYIAKSYPGLNQSMFEVIENGKTRDKVVLLWVYRAIMSAFSGWRWNVDHISNHVVKVAKQAIDMQLKVIKQNIPFSSKSNMDNRFRFIEGSSNFRVACHKKQIVFRLHRYFTLGGDVHHGSFRIESLHNWIIYRDLVILTTYPGGPLAITYTMFLSVLDKIEADFSRELFLSCAEVSWDKMGCEFRFLTEFVYEKLEHAYARLGNQAIKLFKGLETLALGVALQQGPKELCDHDFLHNSIADLLETCDQFHDYVFPITGMFRAYIKKYGDLGTQHVLEQYGQEKMHFFPIVDSEAGLIKMYRIGVSHRYVQNSKVEEALGMFILMYIHQYRMSEGQLPPIYLSKRLDPRISSIYLAGDVPTFSECLKIPLRHWSFVHFKPHKSFNYVESELELLDDKGISPSRSKWAQCYHPDPLATINVRQPSEKDPVRLVEDMLKRESVDVKSYFKECEEKNEIPHEWRLIRLREKERELKIEPRPFAILHPCPRHMSSVAEKNIAETILPLFTQQSMTSTGVELKGRIDDMVAKLGPTNKSWVAMVLDLFQWNYTFRKELQAPFARTLDQIFGVNCFTINQWIFRDAILASANNYHPPGYGSSFSGWIRHNGGNQGIFQKFWTLITLVVIKKVFIQLNLDHIMQGAGDNQVIVFNTDGHKDKKGLVDKVKARLSKEFVAIGLKLKTTETWFSCHLFNYHRQYSLKSSPVSIGLKSVTRAFAEGSDGSMGINNIISTAMNTGVAVAASSSDPLIGPMLAYIEAYINLLGDDRWIGFRALDDISLAMLSCATTDGGFLPFMQIHGFYYSGHGDHLTDSYAIFKRLWDIYPEYHQRIAPFLVVEQGFYDTETALKLIVDPFGLPNHTAGSPEAFIRELIEEYLRKSTDVKNIKLLKFLDHLDREQRLVVCWELMKIRPIDTSFLHTVLEATLVGRSYKVLNKFTKLSTLARTVEYDKRRKNEVASSEKVSGSWSNRIEVLSRFLLRSLKLRLETDIPLYPDFYKTILGGYYEDCDDDRKDFDGEHFLVSYKDFCERHELFFRCTYTLRLYHLSLTSGLLPELVEGPYMPSPIEQLEFPLEFSRYDKCQSLVVLPMPYPDNNEQLYHLTKGPLDIFRGSNTKDSVAQLKLVVLAGRSEGDSVRDLLKLWGWLISMGADDNVLDALTILLDTLCPNVSRELMRAQPKKSGGAYKHRFKSSIEDRGSFLSTNDLTCTRIRISSNCLTTFTEGSEDFMIYFQRIRNHITFYLSLCIPTSKQFLVKIRTDCCTRKVEDPAFKLEKAIDKELIEYPIEFVLSEELEQAMRADIEHSTTFDLTEFPEGLSKEGAICAYLSCQLGGQLYYHEKGLAQKGGMIMSTARFTTQYNTTLFKMVSIRVLLLHIGACLAVRGIFGCKQRMSVLVQTLLEMTAQDIVPVDIGPFTKFLTALVESGKLYELLAISPKSSSYLTASITKQIFRPFLAAIGKVMQEDLHKSYPPLILVEQRYSNQSISYALRFLKMNCDKFQQHRNVCYGMTDRKVLESLPINKHVVNVWVTPDISVSLALAREGLNTLTEDIHIDPELELIRIPPCDHLQSIIINKYNTTLIEKQQNPKTVTRAIAYCHKVSKYGSQIPSARFKLLEMLKVCEVPVEIADRFICLADGGGSYSSVLLHCNDHADLIFNTYLTPDKVSDAALGHCYPAALFCKHELKNRVEECSISAEHYGDLTKSETWLELTGVLRMNPADNMILTFDMESSSPDYYKAINFLLYYIKQWRPIVIIVKLFSVNNEELVDCFVNEINSIYRNVTIYKPSFSSYVSTEFFVVGVGTLVEPTHTPRNLCTPIRAYIHNRQRENNYISAGQNIVQQLLWRRMIRLCPDDEINTDHYGPAKTNTIAMALVDLIRPMVRVIHTSTMGRKGMDVTVHHMLIGKTDGAAQFWAHIDMSLSVIMVVLSNYDNELWWLSTVSSPQELEEAAYRILDDVDTLVKRHSDEKLVEKALMKYGQLINSQNKGVDLLVMNLLWFIRDIGIYYDIIAKKVNSEGLTTSDLLNHLGNSFFPGLAQASSAWLNLIWYDAVRQGLMEISNISGFSNLTVKTFNKPDADTLMAIGMPGVNLVDDGIPVWLLNDGLSKFLDYATTEYIGFIIIPVLGISHPSWNLSKIETVEMVHSDKVQKLDCYVGRVKKKQKPRFKRS